MFWVLGPDTPEEVVGRVASLEHSELVYPERFGNSMRRLPVESVPTHPVDDYRRRIRECAEEHGVTLDNVGYSRLAIKLLDEFRRTAQGPTPSFRRRRTGWVGRPPISSTSGP